MMMLPNQSWCSISFIPHYSFHLALLWTCLSLSSPFLVTYNILQDQQTRAERSPHQTHITLPTRSNHGITSWRLGSITRCCELDSCVVHLAGDPVVVTNSCIYPHTSCSPLNYHNVLSQMKWYHGSLTWRKEWVGRNDRCDGDIIVCRLENHRGCHDGALLALKDWLSRLEWSQGLYSLHGTFGLGEVIQLYIWRVFEKGLVGIWIGHVDQWLWGKGCLVIIVDEKMEIHGQMRSQCLNTGV